VTRIDRYYLRQFLLTALFALLAFIILFVVIDMMENLDDFLDRQATIGIIARYYFYFIPEIVRLMIPVAMLLSALFTTSRFSTYNELTAVKSSGVSLYRFMLPIVIVAVFVSLISVYFNGWIVPDTNKKKLEMGRVYFQKNMDYVSRNNIFIQDSPTRILSIGMFDDQHSVAQQVSIQDFDRNDFTVLVARYDAKQMRWDPRTKSWFLVNGSERRFDADSERIKDFSSYPIGALNFSPDDIRKKQARPEEMGYIDLREFIRSQQRAGHDVSRWLVDLHVKISFPFASLIVVLFAIPFSSVKRRSGPGVEVGIAIAICFLYMAFLQISQAFGYNGELDPLLTAWLANGVFFLAAMYNLWRVPK
jgi:lipopolysaccharide export system permease protein